MADPLFKVSNHHTEPCGEPPTVAGDAPEMYFGYFANEYGEQAIYAYDRETGTATLRMGDAGWGAVHPVVNGEAEDLRLTGAERTWLRACWLATGAISDNARPGAGEQH